MPQPVRRPCHVELVGLAQRPQQAAALGIIVSVSGRLESALGWLLAFFSGGSAAITIPMFHAVTSTDAQKAMLEVAAEKALAGAELIQFQGLMEEFRPRYRERSKLVHNLWGISNDHPDKAVWCASSDAAAFMARIATAKSFSELPSVERGDLAQKCMLYTIKDLQDVAQRLEGYTQQVNSFLNELMSNHPVIAAAASAQPSPSREGELPLGEDQVPGPVQTDRK